MEDNNSPVATPKKLIETDCEMESQKENQFIVAFGEMTVEERKYILEHGLAKEGENGELYGEPETMIEADGSKSFRLSETRSPRSVTSSPRSATRSPRPTSRNSMPLSVKANRSFSYETAIARNSSYYEESKVYTYVDSSSTKIQIETRSSPRNSRPSTPSNSRPGTPVKSAPNTPRGNILAKSASDTSTLKSGGGNTPVESKGNTPKSARNTPFKITTPKGSQKTPAVKTPSPEITPLTLISKPSTPPSSSSRRRSTPGKTPLITFDTPLFQSCSDPKVSTTPVSVDRIPSKTPHIQTATFERRRSSRLSSPMPVFTPIVVPQKANLQKAPTPTPTRTTPKPFNRRTPTPKAAQLLKNSGVKPAIPNRILFESKNIASPVAKYIYNSPNPAKLEVTKPKGNNLTGERKRWPAGPSKIPFLVNSKSKENVKISPSSGSIRKSLTASTSNTAITKIPVPGSFLKKEKILQPVYYQGSCKNLEKAKTPGRADVSMMIQKHTGLYDPEENCSIVQHEAPDKRFVPNRLKSGLKTPASYKH